METEQAAAAARQEEEVIERERKQRLAAATAAAHRKRIRHKIKAMSRVLGLLGNASSVALVDEAAAARDHYLEMAGDTLSLVELEAGDGGGGHEVLEGVLEVLLENYTSIAEVFRLYASSPKGKTQCSKSKNQYTAVCT